MLFFDDANIYLNRAGVNPNISRGTGAGDVHK